MVTDPVGDLLTSIRNVALSKRRELSVPYSKLKQAIAQVLLKEGYLSEVKKIKNRLFLTLALRRRQSVLTGIRNISRPGLRIYRKSSDLPRPLGGAGVSIVSTPQGVMSDKEARRRKLGGEVLGEVW